MNLLSMFMVCFFLRSNGSDVISNYVLNRYSVALSFKVVFWLVFLIFCCLWFAVSFKILALFKIFILLS